MKKWMKKAGLVAASVAAMTTLVSAGPARADIGRVFYFTIQNNTICDATGRYTSLYLNISNIGSSSANVTVHLYNNAGVEVSPTGITNLAYNFPSNLTINSDTTIGSRSSLNYMTIFGVGGAGNVCGDIPAYGKIVVDEGGAIIANGEIKGTVQSSSFVAQDMPILINNGQPF
ncbi:hypothetical protein [Cohnella fermenti]|uniref:Spore coat protein n=1 Tax=Cohnella fermenti TaxID=2565925 RepID=A0A4S4BHA4_9BACL|nr:hypothetical protein [Cohnella fermenti]THF73855.1 hypothetical protein E6C55_27480 [Cohnella fermenti]